MHKIFLNIDKLFEQFEVPREPVRSGMMAAVGQRLRGIWDDGRYSKYSKVSNEEADKILTDKKKLVDNSNKVIREVDKIKDVTDTKEEIGISKKTKAAANFIYSKTGNKDPKAIKTILAQMLAAINTGENPKQQKITLNELAKKYKLNEEQVNGVLKILYDPDAEFNDVESESNRIAKSAGEKSAQTITAKIPAV